MQNIKNNWKWYLSLQIAICVFIYLYLPVKNVNYGNNMAVILHVRKMKWS